MLNNKHPKASPSGEVGGAGGAGWTGGAGGTLYRSLYALLSMGVNPGLPGLPQSLSECRSRGLRLFDRMLDEVRSGSVSPVTLVSDLERSDRWYQLVESVVDRCPAPTGCSGLLQTSLCRCLTDYFYGSPSPETDEWYRHLQSVADTWQSSFLPSVGWGGASPEETLERVEVLNRLSYMFLDASRDSVVRMGYEVCASLMRQTSALSSRCWELWYVLNTAGNACPLNGEEASRAVSVLCRLHRADPVAGFPCRFRPLPPAPRGPGGSLRLPPGLGVPPADEPGGGFIIIMLDPLRVRPCQEKDSCFFRQFHFIQNLHELR